MGRFLLQCLVAILFLATCSEEEINGEKGRDDYFIWASPFGDAQAERIETIPGDPYFVLRMSTCLSGGDTDPKSETYCKNSYYGSQLFIYIETAKIKPGDTIKLANGVPQPFDSRGYGFPPPEGSYAVHDHQSDDPIRGIYYFVKGEIVITEIVENRLYGNFIFYHQGERVLTGLFHGMPLSPTVVYTGGKPYPRSSDPIPCGQVAEHAITSFEVPWTSIQSINGDPFVVIRLTNCFLCPVGEVHDLTLYVEKDKIISGATIQLARGESPPNGATMHQYPPNVWPGSYATYSYTYPYQDLHFVENYYYQWGTIVISGFDNNRLSATINMIGLDGNNSTETYAETISLSDIPISPFDFYPISLSEVYCLK